MAEALLGAPWSRGPLFTHLSPPDPLPDSRALLVPMTFPGSSKAPARHKRLEQRVSPVTRSGVLMGLRRGPRKPSSSRVSSHRVKGEETGVEQEAGRQRSGQAGHQRSQAGRSSAERVDGSSAERAGGGSSAPTLRLVLHPPCAQILLLAPALLLLEPRLCWEVGEGVWCHRQFRPCP